MASSVPKLPEERVNRAAKVRGEWQSTNAVGWQHGEVPKPPPGLLKTSREAWETWMRSWWASHWTPDDLPGLRYVIQLFDQVQRGEFRVAPELRQMMDSYGITPKGKQDRRWLQPKPKELTPATEIDAGPYGGLALVK